MFPLRDNIPSRSIPVVNMALIGANAAAFAYELSLGEGLDSFLRAHGVIPARYAAERALWSAKAHLLPLLSSVFLHGGWLHLISNMWTLFIFGDNVEDRLGHFRYLFFYLLCGLAASFSQLWMSWGSPIPMIGASGAIAGVMGAYFILFPHARVVTLIPIFIFLHTVEVPAFVFLGLWLWAQVQAGGLSSVATAGKSGGIAWWAHIGGFAAGVALLGPFLIGRGRRRRY